MVLAWKLFGRFSSASASQKDGPRKPLAASSTDKVAVTLFLMSMLRARRQRLRALPCDPTLPPAKRRLDADLVRRATKGASGVRWCAHVPQPDPLHTRQWVGTYGGRGNGDYQRELASTLRSITT